MADIDPFSREAFSPPCPNCKGTGKVLSMSFKEGHAPLQTSCHVCKSSGKLYDQEAHLNALAADRDRLSRELALWQSAAERFGAERDALHLQLAESERLAAARNQLNGELAMENERLREALRKYGRHAFACSTNREYTGWLNHQPDHCTCGLDAALTAPATASGGAT